MQANPYESPQPGISSQQPGCLPVRATGVVTAEDAQRALRAASSSGRIALIVIACATVPACIAMTLMDTHQWWAAAFQLVILLGIGSLLLFFTQWRSAASWNARPENQHPVTWTFSDDGLLVETANSKHLHYWSSFLYARIPSDKVILAQHGGAVFNFVPRRCFETDEDWTAVSQLVALKLPVR